MGYKCPLHKDSFWLHHSIFPHIALEQHPKRTYTQEHKFIRPRQYFLKTMLKTGGTVL